MNSNYVHSEEGLEGFFNKAGKGALTSLKSSAKGAAMGTAIAPGIGTAIGAGAGEVLGIVKSIFGGGGPDPADINHGSLVANIASFDRASKDEARQAAQKAVQMYVAGQPMSKIEKKINEIIGYGSVSPKVQTVAWQAIHQEIRQLGEKAKKKNSTSSLQNAKHSSMLLPIAFGAGVLGIGGFIIAANK
jgi:hypothetical protein